MTHVRKLFALAFSILLLTSVFAQNPSAPGYGRYGVTGWAINNQRVASQYNYYIDSTSGSGLGTFTFPQSTIYQALPLAQHGNINPFNTNATVNIIDINSSLTETVAFNSQSCTTGAGVAAVCTLSLANSIYRKNKKRFQAVSNG